MKKIILIGGTMGVGKSTTAKELLNILSPSVWLDGDWCWYMNPWNFRDENKKMVMDNITHTLNNYIQNDYFNYIIFSWVLHKQEIIDDMLSQLNLNDECEVHAFSLVCSKPELEKRFLNDNREIENLDNSFGRMEFYHDVNTIKINTSNLSALEVAKKIEKHINN